jgi:hypothetical protein
MSDRLSVWGTVAGVAVLFDKAETVIAQFGSTDPDVAPFELCRLNFLLAFLRDRDVTLYAKNDDVAELAGDITECIRLLEEYGPPPKQPASSISGPYSWTPQAESRLEELNDKIDEKLVNLRFEASLGGETVFVSISPAQIIRLRNTELTPSCIGTTGHILDLPLYVLPSEHRT